MTVRAEHFDLPHDPEVCGFVDLHCHMLPALDDGARDLAEALAMARIAVEDGIRAAVLTPHQLGQNSQITGDAIRSAVESFRNALARERIPLQVFPGADVRIEPHLAERIVSGEVLSVADGRKYVLLELPHEVYVPLDGVLDALAAQGVRGILTHPERNQGLLAHPQLVHELVDRGCLMQVTAGSLLGNFGSRSLALAVMMVKNRLVHFVSSDGHNTRSRRPELREAFDFTTTLIDRATAGAIFCGNPAAAVAGAPLAEPTSRPRRRAGFWSSLFGRRKAG